MSTRVPTAEELLDCLNREYHLYQPDIDVLEEKADSDTYEYLCRCNVCKQTFYKPKIAIRKGTACPICIGKVVVKGVNDIATTAPWMMDYMADKEDAYKYTRSSGKKILFRCPVCGEPKKTSPNDICEKGFRCPICSDGISKPNRFARALFRQLPVKKLKFEYFAEWTKGKFYDVYFQWDNKQYVVEMDGSQHFADSRGFLGPYEDVNKNDLYKEMLAEKNNVVMIRVPCKDPFNASAIRQYLLDSELGKLISSVEVDWEKCLKEADTNYLNQVCGYYNDHHLSVKRIASLFDFSPTTVRNYLNYGTALGICDYKPRISLKRPKKENDDDYSFDVFKGDEYIGTFNDPQSCKKELEKFGYALSSNRITKALLYRMTHKGLTFIYKNYSLEEMYNDNPIIGDVCDYYNVHSDMTNKEIAKTFSITPERVGGYLTIGAKLGVCGYSPSIHFSKASYREKVVRHNTQRFPVSVYDNDTLIGNYLSVSKAVEEMNNMFPSKNFVNDTVNRHLKRNGEESFLYKGLTFKIYKQP